MCACKLNVVPKAKAVAYAYQIPLQEFSAPNSRCKFKVMFCTSPEKVNRALSGLNIKIENMAQMEKLADHYDSGQATAYYKTDIWNLLNAIKFTPEELAKTECDLACTI